MEQRAEKPLSDALTGSTTLRRLARAQQIFEALDSKLQPLLPAAARGKICVACVQDSTLVLAAASSTWAVRARLEAERLLAAAHAVWPKPLERVKVIVSPAVEPREL